MNPGSLAPEIIQRKPVTGREEALKRRDAAGTTVSPYLSWDGMTQPPKYAPCGLAVPDLHLRSPAHQLPGHNQLYPSPFPTSTSPGALYFLSRDSRHLRWLLHVGLIQSLSRKKVALMATFMRQYMGTDALSISCLTLSLLGCAKCACWSSSPVLL